LGKIILSYEYVRFDNPELVEEGFSEYIRDFAVYLKQFSDDVVMFTQKFNGK
jgi:hypothetical protein